MATNAHKGSTIYGGGMAGFNCGPRDHFFPFFTHNGKIARSTKGAGDYWHRGWNVHQPGFTGIYNNAGYVGDVNAEVLYRGGPFGMNALWLGYHRSYSTGLSTHWFDSFTSGRPTNWADNAGAGGSAIYTQLAANEQAAPVLAPGRYVCRMDATVVNRGLYQSVTLKNQSAAAKYVLYGWMRVNRGTWNAVAEGCTAENVYVRREDGVMIRTTSNVAGGVSISSADCNGLWVFFCVQFTYPGTNVVRAMTFYAGAANSCADLYLPNLKENYWPSPTTASTNASTNSSCGFVLPKGILSNKRFSVGFWACFPQAAGWPPYEKSTYPRIISLGDGDYNRHDGFNVFWNSSTAVMTLKSWKQGNATVTQNGTYNLGSWKAWEWHYVLLDYDNRNMRLYIDNVLIATNPLAGPVSFLPADGTHTHAEFLTIGNSNGSKCELVVSGLVVRSGGNFTAAEREALMTGPVYDPMDFSAINNFTDPQPNNLS